MLNDDELFSDNLCTQGTFVYLTLLSNIIKQLVTISPRVMQVKNKKKTSHCRSNSKIESQIVETQREVNIPSAHIYIVHERSLS